MYLVNCVQQQEPRNASEENESAGRLCGIAFGPAHHQVLRDSLSWMRMNYEHEVLSTQDTQPWASWL